VLRYDKRTCHPDGSAAHEKCTDNLAALDLSAIVIDDFVADAAAALRRLAAHGLVQPAGLTVIGHSQGAFPVGPMAAAAVPAVGQLVLLMGPGLPIDQIYLEQIAAAGGPAAVDAMRPAFAALNAAAAGGADGDGIDTTALGGGADAGRFWVSWLRATSDRHFAAVLRALSMRGVRMLAVNRWAASFVQPIPGATGMALRRATDSPSWGVDAGCQQ
jgi:hypothetical protein